jgi:hypothetical protein
VDADDRAGAYLDDCKAQSRKVCDLTTYLREKRWVRFTRRQPKPSVVLVKADTPQFYRWIEHRKATGDWSEMKERFWKREGAMAVPSEWPPSDSIAKTG